VSDPVRIREASSDAPEELRELFRSAPRPEPLAPAVQAMLSTRVATIGTAPSSLLVKVLPLVLGGTVVLGGVAAYRARRAEPLARPRVAATAPAQPEVQEPVEPVAAPAPTPPEAASPRRAPATRAATQAPAPSAGQDDDGLVGEERLLNEAHQVLSADPRKALALARSHARRYPHGQLVAERQLITIEALVALGRRREAEALARDLRKTAPNNIYEERLDEILRPR
jgi:hypothetical protein